MALCTGCCQHRPADTGSASPRGPRSMLKDSCDRKEDGWERSSRRRRCRWTATSRRIDRATRSGPRGDSSTAVTLDGPVVVVTRRRCTTGSGRGPSRALRYFVPDGVGRRGVGAGARLDDRTALPPHRPGSGLEHGSSTGVARRPVVIGARLPTGVLSSRRQPGPVCSRETGSPIWCSPRAPGTTDEALAWTNWLLTRLCDRADVAARWTPTASLTPAPSERTCVWLARGQGGPERAVMRSREVSLGLRCGWQQRLHLLGEVVEARPEGAAERGGESVLGKVRPVPLHDRR